MTREWKKERMAKKILERCETEYRREIKALKKEVENSKRRAQKE